MWSSSLFQAMTMAPEALEPFAALPFSAALLLVPAVSRGEMTNVATTEPITRTMPIAAAQIKLNFFFFKSAFSF
jgi:hypothetical protein